LSGIAIALASILFYCFSVIGGGGGEVIVTTAAGDDYRSNQNHDNSDQPLQSDFPSADL
jgi:hypothetical protein